MNKEYKFDDLVIKYRRPNFADAQILLGQIGIGSIEEKDGVDTNLIFLGKTINAMGFLVDEITIKGENYNYQWLLRSEEFANHLASVAADVIESVMGFSSKKKTH